MSDHHPHHGDDMAALGGGEGGEMSAFIWLLINSFVMFAGAMAMGMLPAYMHLAESKIRSISTLGAGIIVGAALAVIIPEGVEAFYGAKASLKDGEELPHGAVGAALTLGFVAMLVIDSFALGHGHGHSHGDVKSRQSPPGTDDEGDVSGGGQHSHTHARSGGGAASGGGMKTLLGLVIHSAADGFAVGAAALSGSGDLNFMVFLAIMLHKAPAAFGLGTYLLHARWGVAELRKGMAAFSAAAPVAAIATYLLFRSTPALTSPQAVALCLLFSGGTFLYAATMHIIPEVLGSTGHLTTQQVILTAVGALFPLVISLMHTHDHGGGHGHDHAGHSHGHHHDLK